MWTALISHVGKNHNISCGFGREPTGLHLKREKHVITSGQHGTSSTCDPMDFKSHQKTKTT